MNERQDVTGVGTMQEENTYLECAYDSTQGRLRAVYVALVDRNSNPDCRIYGLEDAGPACEP